LEEDDNDDVYEKPQVLKANVAQQSGFDLSQFYSLNVNKEVKDLLGFIAR